MLSGTVLSAAQPAASARRGRVLFTQRGCAACHAVDGKTASAGPDLSQPVDGVPLTEQQLLESIQEPSKKIRKGYETWAVVLASGQVLSGRLTEESDDSVTLVSLSSTQELKQTVVSREDIDDLVPQSASLMPQGLLKGLKEIQIRDLLAYLKSLTDPESRLPPEATIPAKLPGVTRPMEDADVTFYSPEESMKRIHLAPGYHLQLVAAEPMIEEPVLCVWDADNRMYVAEMRTYMQDADGTDQDLPRSRVSRLEDTDGDGVMDRVTRFAENMVLPRMILPLDDRIIINETYTNDYYSYRDTDGDGVADERELLYAGGRAGGNLEHQNSGLTWGIDNWIYTTRLGWRRHRLADGEWLTEKIHGSHGQWGLAMDDVGRFFLATAGGENPAYGFQQLPQYGQLSLPGEKEPGFERVYPIVRMLDVQGGLGRVDDERRSLNHFTGCAGQSIYRGDALPADLYGDYIVPEPVGRLVRRAKVTQIQGKYVLSNAYDESEFIASTDKNFRPLWSATGPDGFLYIVDMYRGIIQESAWTNKGSYLRKVIDQEGFAKNVGRGRIYRVVHDTAQRQPAPTLLQASSAELVQQLSHGNGWRRDTAQKLLVLRQDQSVVPLLQQVVSNGSVPLGRMHALWTLDGLGASESALVQAAMQDEDSRVRLAALRISEQWLEDNPELITAVGNTGYGDDVTVAVQAINSLRYGGTAAARQQISEIASLWPTSDLVLASSQNSLNYREGGGGAQFAGMNAELLLQMQRGYESYSLVCIRCHGPDGTGAISSDGLQLAPSLAESARVLAPAHVSAAIVLHGLSGPVDGRTYPGVMESMKRQEDEWIADALTYVRNSFGNSAGRVSPHAVASARAATADRSQPWTMADFAAWQRVPSEEVAAWQWTSSAGAVRLSSTENVESGMTTSSTQQPGQWLQCDAGQPYEFTSIRLVAADAEEAPQKYELRVSDDGVHWSEPWATGTATATDVRTIITPEEGCRGRYLRVTQTGSDDQHVWSVQQVEVYGRPAPTSPQESLLAGRRQLEQQQDLSDADRLQLGELVYRTSCQQCHGRTGQGRVDRDGHALASMVNGRSEAMRHTDVLVRIALQGVVGQDRSCPGLTEDAAELRSRQAASVLTWLRRTFHADLSEITESQVQAIQGQSTNDAPWTAEQLARFLPISRAVMKTWKIDASHGGGDLSRAIDGDRGTRYSTGTSMKPGMWITIDMQQDHQVRQIVLDSTRSAGDYPRGYAVSVSTDGEDWSDPVVVGAGESAVTQIDLPHDLSTRYLRIEQTGHHGLWWSIHELMIFGSRVP